MSILPASGIGDESTGFYPVEIDQSLRFDGSSSYLTKTPSSNSNRRKWTFSAWIKLSELGDNPSFFGTSRYNSSNREGFAIGSSQTLQYQLRIGGTTKALVESDALLQDTTNWYHIMMIWDSDNATAADRVIFYINNQRTGLTTYTTPVQYSDSFINSTNQNYIGWTTGGSNYLNGYMAEVNFVDGQALTPSSFGETKNGVWIPKSVSGLTYGTNGFRLTFEATGTGTTADGTDNSSSMTNIGDDKSGNGRNYAVNGLASTDVCTDAPTNNFAVFSELNSDSNTTLYEGGLRATMGGSGNYDQVRSDFGLSSGKWYWEVYVEDRGYIPAIGVMAGYTGPSTNPTHWVTFGFGQWHITYNSGISKYNVNQNSGGGTNWSVTMPTHGDVVMVAIDVDNNKIWWGLNGTWYNSSGTANPATGTDPRVTLTSDQTWHPIVTLDTGAPSVGANNAKMRINFGQESTFQGGKSAGTNSDENGNGLFQYAPPSGYLACCSSSLPDVTIGPDSATQADDNFNTVTYSGDGQTTNDITGVGFKPDWTWIKERESDGSHIASHVLADSSRGYEYFLVSNATNADSTGILNNNSTRSNDGFQTTNSGASNQSGQPYVAWNWKLNGGTTVSNTDGSLTSTVQANTDAGFSIVLWTGDGNASVTLGHGLNETPELIIYKGRDSTYSWPVWYKTFSTTSGFFLDNTNSAAAHGRVKSVPTSTVIGNVELNYTNELNKKNIAYCFHSVEGYSKIDSYTGNGSTDGTFVYTGFRPAWIITKKSSGTGNWYINDSARSPFNSTNLFGGNLYADLSNAEGGNGMDMLSNGFKIRNTDSSQNTSGSTYIYMAFAEQPFKFSNGR